MKMPKVSVRFCVWLNVCRPLGNEEAMRTKIKALSSNNYESNSPRTQPSATLGSVHQERLTDDGPVTRAL